MDVGIVGAGVGGLTLALSLHKLGFRNIEIFESATSVSELGVGVNILPHAMKIMDELGLLNKLVGTSVETETLKYYTHRGQLIVSDPRGRKAGNKWPQISIHRGDLIRVLHETVKERLGERCIHVNHALTGLVQRSDRKVAAQFPQGEKLFDLLVGCDGVHSVVRAHFYPNEGAPKWDGITMWRAVSLMPANEVFESMVIAGKSSQRMVMYPIKKNHDSGFHLVNWVAKYQTSTAQPMPKQDWIHSARKGDIPDCFKAFTFLNVDALIANAHHIYKYPQVDRDPLPNWNFGTVTLLGDAAHPMYPSGSNGASQAIIDASVLAKQMAQNEFLPKALQEYDEIRRPATTAIVLKNREAGPEKLIDVVEQRAPHGFTDIRDVISNEEAIDILSTYKKTAGFDQVTLNNAGPAFAI